MENRPKVVFEEYVIPHYRVPFFSKLAEYADLTLVTSKNRKVDGLVEKKENLPFEHVLLDAEPKSGLYHPEIFRVAEEKKADILISGSFSLDLMLNNKKALDKIKSLGLKVLWTGCDGYAVRHPRLNLLWNLLHPKRPFRTVREIIAKSRVDHFLPYSSHTSHYLQKRLFVPENKITVAHNAIDTAILREKFLEWRKNGSKREPYKISFTGRLVPRKNIDCLLKAFALVSTKYPEAKLEIIGEGSDTDNLKNLTKELGMEEKINFTGGIYDDRVVADHLLSSSLFVMPAVGGLGFNTAMACALPIIYTHADGTEEDIFTEGENGWFFDGSISDLVKKIQSAFSMPEKLLQIGLLSESLITNKFNISNLVNSYILAINKVLKKNE